MGAVYHCRHSKKELSSKMLFKIFTTTGLILTAMVIKLHAEKHCLPPFCLSEDYQRSAPPNDPMTVKVYPFLREIFKVSDEDFSITFEADVLFSWPDERITFNNTNERAWFVDQELLNQVWGPKFDIRHMDEDRKDPKGLIKILVNKNEALILGVRVNMKPTITCKMRFDWYPFDEQPCYFVIQSLDSFHDVEFVTVKQNDFFAPDYVENVLLDYDLEITRLPEKMESMSLGSEFDSFMKDLYYDKGTPSIQWSNAGFQIRLKRRWVRYILIYYVPSALCVVASWASFFISSTSKSLSARCGLLVTLFLTLTTLLISTIVSSPRVGSITALTTWMIIQYVFIIMAMAYLAFMLISFRHSMLSEEDFKKFESKMDIRCLAVFVIAYFIVTGIYLGIAINHIS